MAELAYDTVAEARLLEAADFDSGQAEAIVSSVNRAMACNHKLAEDLASIKARLGADLVTKDDIRDMLVKDDIRNMVVKDDIRDMLVKDDIRNMLVKDDIRDMLVKDDIRDMLVKDDIRDMVVKDDIRDMVVKDDIRDMVVKDDIRDMVVKDDIRDMATRDCLTEIMAEFRAEARENFATKTEIAEFRVDMADGFLRMYRSFAMGALGICGLILALVPIILLK